jgi:hypothetical protein
MATPKNTFFDNYSSMSKELGITSITAPQLSSNPFASLFNQGPSSSLSSSLNIPEGVGLSQESSTPIGNGSAQNSAQSAQKEQSNLQKAFEGVQSLYDPMGGRPIAGSEDVKVKVDAYGRPYTVVNMSARDSSGQFKERTEFDLSGKPVKTRGDIMEGMGKVGNQQPESQKSQDNRSAYIQSVNDSYAPKIAQQKSIVAQEEEKRKRGEI